MSVLDATLPFRDTNTPRSRRSSAKASIRSSTDLGGFYLHNHDYLMWKATCFLAAIIGSYSDDMQNSKAIYGQGTYDLSSIIPKLKFTAGARYTWDNEANQAQACPAGWFGAGILHNPGCSPIPVPTNVAANSAFTWNLALNYQLDPNTLLYVSGRRGYRAGSFNGGAANAHFQNTVRNT